MFKTENRGELRFILDELMFDLEQDQARRILDHAWSRKFGFLTIKSGQPPDKKYFRNFDLIDLNQI
ncbi:MAG TPA: hypothetical protein DCW74_14195 [Alteromonas australica]|uniref:Uncharacterized protein n=1 Tax=Alteromonas australica TaxID=589873 RepID=A0A350P6F3_9ALTE|nr:hypothetical protein [Alteromonas australica]